MFRSRATPERQAPACLRLVITPLSRAPSRYSPAGAPRRPHADVEDQEGLGHLAEPQEVASRGGPGSPARASHTFKGSSRAGTSGWGEPQSASAWTISTPSRRPRRREMRSAACAPAADDAPNLRAAGLSRRVGPAREPGSRHELCVRSPIYRTAATSFAARCRTRATAGLSDSHESVDLCGSLG